jgi:HK97 family phage portal protein
MKFPFFGKQESSQPTGAQIMTSSWQDGQPAFKTNDYQRQLEYNTKWVYAAVQIIADTCASVPLRFYVVQSNADKQLLHKHVKCNKWETERLYESSPRIRKELRDASNGELVEITSHPTIDLLDKVNNHQNGTDLQKLKWTYERLTGNAYWYKERNSMGVPIALWTLHTPNVAVIPSSTDFISGYEYRVDTRTIKLDDKDVVHFYDPSPHSPYYGMSPLAAAVDSVTLQRYMDKFGIDLFHNQAIPQTVLQTDAMLKSGQVDRIQNAWKSMSSFLRGFTGGSKPVILDSGLKVHTLTIPPQDLNYAEGKIAVPNEILSIFRVPTTKVEASEVRANTSAGDEQFMRDTVKPLLTRDEEKINEKLIPDFDPSGRLVALYDDPVPSDKEFQLKKNVEEAKAGIVTRDEVRAQRGLEPLEDGQGATVPPWPGQLPAMPELSDDDKAYADDMAKEIAKHRIGY